MLSVVMLGWILCLEYLHNYSLTQGLPPLTKVPSQQETPSRPDRRSVLPPVKGGLVALQASKALGTGPADTFGAPGAKSGYMDICTAHGLVRVPAPNLPPASSNENEQPSPITECPTCFTLKQIVVPPPGGSIRVALHADPLSWDLGAEEPSLDLGPPGPLRSRAPPPRTTKTNNLSSKGQGPTVLAFLLLPVTVAATYRCW